MKHRKKEAVPADCEFAAVQVNMAIESGKQINEEKINFKMFTSFETVTNFGNDFVMFCW